MSENSSLLCFSLSDMNMNLWRGMDRYFTDAGLWILFLNEDRHFHNDEQMDACDILYGDFLFKAEFTIKDVDTVLESFGGHL